MKFGSKLDEICFYILHILTIFIYLNIKILLKIIIMLKINVLFTAM